MGVENGPPSPIPSCSLFGHLLFKSPLFLVFKWEPGLSHNVLDKIFKVVDNPVFRFVFRYDLTWSHLTPTKSMLHHHWEIPLSEVVLIPFKALDPFVH